MEAVLAARTFEFAAPGRKFDFIDLAGQMAGGTFDFHWPARSSFKK
jgi:hypothetical protein